MSRDHETFPSNWRAKNIFENDLGVVALSKSHRFILLIVPLFDDSVDVQIPHLDGPLVLLAVVLLGKVEYLAFVLVLVQELLEGGLVVGSLRLQKETIVDSVRRVAHVAPIVVVFRFVQVFADSPQADQSILVKLLSVNVIILPEF